MGNSGALARASGTLWVSKFTGKLALHTYCTSMLWSIDSCQNRVSADQYHLTVSRAQVSTHRGRVFFEVIRWQASWNLFTLKAETDRVLCQLVIFITAFLYWMYRKWNSAAIKSLLLFVASLFNGFLVEKYVACQSRKSDLGWHRFRFSPCLMRERVKKSAVTW